MRDMTKAQEKPTVEQVMKLVEQLTPGEREQILDQLKMDDLRRAIQVGIEQADQGKLVDREEVFRKLRERNSAFREKLNQ
jgi:predicted transcriptional regulator